MPTIDHDAFVIAWMSQTAAGRSARQLIELLDRALNALSGVAKTTLGEVTLTAIVDRVLYNAVERHPYLEDLKFESSRVTSKKLLERATLPDEATVRDGLRFVLVEFLTVLGNLTAEILTPAFHAELEKLAAVAKDNRR
jgi:hypothetical protein